MLNFTEKKTYLLLLAFIATSVVLAGIGLFFYQALAAFDNDLGFDNDLVFFVPKDKQKETIIESLRRIEKDLQGTNSITDEDLETLNEIDSLLDFSDDLFINTGMTADTKK